MKNSKNTVDLYINNVFLVFAASAFWLRFTKPMTSSLRVWEAIGPLLFILF